MKQTPHNSAMVGKVNAAIDSIIDRCKVEETPKDQLQTFAASIKDRFVDANKEHPEFSGIISLAWVYGGQEHVLLWTLKQGSIMQFTVKRHQPGLIRVTHEQTFFN